MTSTDHGLVNTDIAMLTCTGKLMGRVRGGHSYPSNFHKVLESGEMVSEHLKFECSVKELQ